MITMTEAQVAEALFVSDLQPGQPATAALIHAAITETLARYGPDGCATRMASAFGDQPDLATRRMIWVRRAMRAAGW